MTRTNSTIQLSRVLLLGAIGFLVLPVLEGSAQEAAEDPWAGVEEMVVSGSTAGGILADVAQSNSVTAFSSDDLEAIGAADISDLASFTPNLEIVTAGSTSPTFFIRGIGLNDFNANAAGAVAVYSDDVALNSPALQLGSLFDIEAANVLRGPQGTGNYRNASAGAIKVYSRKPTGEYGANFKAEFGNFNSKDFEGALQFPITEETVWARVSFRAVERDGTLRNRCAGAPPRSERMARPGGSSPTDTRWSYCGESVLTNNTSLIDAGMDERINARNNWAARGVFLIQPDLGPGADVDMEWLLTARGSQRDEPSYLGQSIGSLGIQQWIDPVTGAQTQPSVAGLLGGPDTGDYTDVDITNAFRATRDKIRSVCDPNCTQPFRRFATTEAQKMVANDLARDLDHNPYAGAYSHQGGTTNDTYGGSIKGTIEFGDIMEMTTVTGYDGWQRVVDVDLDFTSNTAFEIQTADHGEQIYQELRFNGQAFEGLDEIYGGPLEWEVGAFFLREDLHTEVDVSFGPATALAGAPTFRKYDQTVQSTAGYVTLGWDFWDAFTLDGGFRFNYEKRDIDYLLVVNGPSRTEQSHLIGNEPTGTVRLTWRPNETSSVYAKYTHGWKSGTFNATGSAQLLVTNANPEKVDAFEVGLRGSYFEDRLSLTLSLFHYAYQNYQLFTSQSAFQAPPQFVILNASDVELFGSEVEATILPWPGGVIDVKFAWLSGEFLNFVQTQLVSVQVGNVGLILPRQINNSGNTLLNAPKYTVTLTLAQAFPLGPYGSMNIRYDVTWKDKTFYDATEGRGIANVDDQVFLPENTIGQSAYWLQNIRLAYITPNESIEVAGWIRNLTNESYKTFSADLTTFQDTTLHFVGDPRTYGVTTSFRF